MRSMPSRIQHIRSARPIALPANSAGSSARCSCCATSPTPKFCCVIRAETTKIETYNEFLDWVSFGGPVIKSGDPLEQEKQLKYASLVANTIMLSNIVDMTAVLSSMAADGHAVTPDLVACASPYIRGHILRFGQYALDMGDTPPPLDPQPLPFEIN